MGMGLYYWGSGQPFEEEGPHPFTSIVVCHPAPVSS